MVMVACGKAHMLVVTHNGALWACGKGLCGQLGLNDEAYRLVFERPGVGAFGGARVVAAATGGYHSVAVTEDGALWTWGDGNDGRLGHGDEERRLVPTVVLGAGLGGGRIGRCRGLSAEHALVFAMGTHGRLGGARQSSARKGRGAFAKPASPIFRLKEELVGMIVRLCGPWPAGRAGETEGLVRLLGGSAEAGWAMLARPGMSIAP